jgi:hypothetical protein
MRLAGARRPACVVAVAGLLGAGVVACGSSSASASAQVEQSCRQLEAVLSDGPEPAADPVGYAQAQVLPLRHLRTSDKRLHGAIEGLASAYQAFSAKNGVGRSARDAVTAAAERVDAICPRAAS